MNAMLGKEEQRFLTGRDPAGNPTIFGPHLLTYVQVIPGVWFLVDMRPAR